MASPVEICNMALGRIGSTVLIASLEAPSNKEERQCALWYAPMRDFALRELDPNFARRRRALSDLGDPPTNWAYRYAYPSDCLAARYLALPGKRQLRVDERIPFEIANNGTVKTIDTDQPEAELVYTTRLENSELFDPTFVSALAYLIGSELAMPITGKPEIGTAMRNAYVLVASSAAASGMRESQEGPVPDCDLLAIRGLSSTTDADRGVFGA